MTGAPPPPVSRLEAAPALRLGPERLLPNARAAIARYQALAAAGNAA